MSIKSMSDITLYNTLTRQKELFEPIDEHNIRLYVCGPTVYDYAHIGNARSAIVFDVLFRILRHKYGSQNVTYVRNITDVDDKIIHRARCDFPDMDLNQAIGKVTSQTEAQYQADMKALGCLEPSHAPRATQNIPQMLDLVKTLVKKGNAYQVQNADGLREVLFDTSSQMPAGYNYGQLSNRRMEDQQAGARIAVEAHKRNPGDFVLWKQAVEGEPGWESEFEYGRPGWHLECSAMSARYLGQTFDIHGGGLDLVFPHHENEIAQSCCAHGTPRMANVWMHNGYLQLEGKKMSKSDGNFITVHDLLHTDKFGGRKWSGEVLRLAMLMTHYREPIDLSVSRLQEAEARLKYLKKGLEGHSPAKDDEEWKQWLPGQVLKPLYNDMNFALSYAQMSSFVQRDNPADRQAVFSFLKILGLSDASQVEKVQIDEAGLQSAIEQRLNCLEAKNWAEADRIRDELKLKGIQLKDGKDETGNRVTTWEIIG